MAPTKRMSVTPELRVFQYPHEGLHASADGRLICDFCNNQLKWERKGSIDAHIGTDIHKMNKAAWERNKEIKQSPAETPSNPKKVKKDNKASVESTVRTFLKAGIPLEKLHHPEMRKWLETYVSGDLSSAQDLREKWVPLLQEEFKTKLKATLEGRKIVILCNVTKDENVQAVLLILFKLLPSQKDPKPHLFVASREILDNVNASQCSEAIRDTLLDYGVLQENVVGVTSNGINLIGTCIIQLNHFINLQSWAYKLDKVLRCFFEELEELNRCITFASKLFQRTKETELNYVQFLNQEYPSTRTREAKQFPIPVGNRWDTWIKSIRYLYNYIEYIVKYCKSLEETVDTSPVKRYFLNLKLADISIIKAQATFLSEYCVPIHDLQLKVEHSKYPMSHLLYSEISKLRDLLSKIASAEDHNIKSALTKKTEMEVNLVSDPTPLLKKIKDICKSCDSLLESLVNEDTAREFFESSKLLFNPDSMYSLVSLREVTEEVVEAKKKIAILNSIEIEDFKIKYLELVHIVKANMIDNSSGTSEGEDFVVNALMDMRQRYPDFVTYCLQVLHVNASSGDIERDFTKDKVEAMECLYGC